jgi:hypothetical protein
MTRHVSEARLAWPERLLVDGHVHFHDCFAAPEFLDAAAANLDRVAPAGSALGCLMLAETGERGAFTRLLHSLTNCHSGWEAFSTDEAASLVVAHPSHRPLLLVAGRQLDTSEGLELLALGTTEIVPAARPLRESIGTVRRFGACPVVPWGFGKWWFRRGRTLAELLDDGSLGDAFLGDNGGRTPLVASSLLRRARRAGRPRILAGSDPLPLRAHARRAGRYGFVIDGPCDRLHPWRSLRQRLAEQRASPATFGRLERLPRFVLNQLALQLSRRPARRPPAASG